VIQKQKRPSKEVWAKAREVWEADPRPGYAWLIEQVGLGVSDEAVRKRAISEGWAKAETLEGMRIKAHRAADKKLAAREKVGSKVGEPTFSNELEAAIDHRAAIIDQQRGDWAEFRELFPMADLKNDPDRAKTADIVAKVYMTVQMGERKTWALDEQPPEQQKGGATEQLVNATILAVCSKAETAKVKRLADIEAKAEVIEVIRETD